MNKARELLLAVCVLVIANMIVGCKAENNVPEEEHKWDISQGFTARQKELLEMKGWPEDVNQLDSDQKEEVIYAAACLQYIEEKYPDDKFEYVEYLGGEDIGDVWAYGIKVKSEKYKDIDPVNVCTSYSSKKHKHVFLDNYEVTIAMCKLRNDIIKDLENKKPGVQIKNYMAKGVIEDGKTMETDDLLGEPIVLFTTDVFSGPEDVEQTMREIAEDLLKKYDEKMVWFIFIGFDEKDFENVEPTVNYGNNYLSGSSDKPKGLYQYRCIVEDGIVDVERWD